MNKFKLLSILISLSCFILFKNNTFGQYNNSIYFQKLNNLSGERINIIKKTIQSQKQDNQNTILNLKQQRQLDKIQLQNQKKIERLTICKRQEQKLNEYYNKIVALNKALANIKRSSPMFLNYEKELNKLLLEYEKLMNDIQKNSFDISFKDRLKVLTEKTKTIIESIKIEIQKIKRIKKM